MVVSEKLNLASITREEVKKFAGRAIGGQIHVILDDANRRYGLIFVPEKADDRPAWMMLFARIVDDFVVIEEDTAIDKTLVDALMVNGGVPREQIILAYKGEIIPEAAK